MKSLEGLGRKSELDLIRGKEPLQFLEQGVTF